MSLAPIVLFVYNRLDHTKLTIEALQKNVLAKQSELFIFSDGAKTTGNNDAVKAVRNYIHNVTGFKNVTVIERPVNFGLANSIIDGVTDIVNRYGEIIVMEDDLVTSPYFLQYMNDALSLYKDEQSVVCIHGYVLPVNEPLPGTFFLQGADCWGWATWQRGWNVFNPDSIDLMKQLRQRKLDHRFDFDGCVPYTQMLQQQIDGAIDSWAIRWHAAAFLQNKLTLYPGKTLVKNIGVDGSGTHKEQGLAAHEPHQQKIELGNIPVEESKVARAIICRYFYNQKSILGKLKKLLKGMYRS